MQHTNMEEKRAINKIELLATRIMPVGGVARAENKVDMAQSQELFNKYT